MTEADRIQRRIRTRSAEGIVLRHNDWGEADRLLVIFTREQGKLRAIAKGVRKPHSRKTGHLEPFTHVKLLLARGRDLAIVTQAEAIDLFQPLREDMLLTSYASYVVELLDRFTYEEGENLPLYRLLKDSLSRLCTESQSELVLRYYEMRLLDLVGFRPQLFNCVNCEKEIEPQDQYFSAPRGGALCPNCGRIEPGSRPVTETTLKYMRHFQRSSYKEAARANPSPAIYKEMESLMGHYLTYVLEHGLNTPAFIKRARKKGKG